MHAADSQRSTLDLWWTFTCCGTHLDLSTPCFTSSAHPVPRWHHIIKMKEKPHPCIFPRWANMIIHEFSAVVKSQKTEFFQQICAASNIIFPKSLAWHSIWPVPCPRRRSAAIKTLCWPNSLYVAQPPSERLVTESHLGDSLFCSERSRRGTDCFYEADLSSAVGQSTRKGMDGAAAERKWKRASSQSSGKTLMRWCNLNFSQTLPTAFEILRKLKTLI